MSGSHIVWRMVLGYITHWTTQSRYIESKSSLCSLSQTVQSLSNFDKVRVITGTFTDYSTEFVSKAEHLSGQGCNT